MLGCSLKNTPLCWPILQSATATSIGRGQDTSKIQFELIHLLVARWGNLFMVGDEDQSIYGFRGAYPQGGLLDFETQYPQGKVLLMETNYRSTGALVASASRFVPSTRSDTPKMTTPNALGVPAVQEYVKLWKGTSIVFC